MEQTGVYITMRERDFYIASLHDTNGGSVLI